MAVPARPTSGTPIESLWGQVAHDTAVAMDLQAGDVAVTVSAAVSGQTIVTFPRVFAAAPVVVASVRASSIAYICQVSSVSASQVTLVLTHKTAGTTFTDTRNVSWIAYGPRA